MSVCKASGDNFESTIRLVAWVVCLYRMLCVTLYTHLLIILIGMNRLKVMGPGTHNRVRISYSTSSSSSKCTSTTTRRGSFPLTSPPVDTLQSAPTQFFFLSYTQSWYTWFHTKDALCNHFWYYLPHLPHSGTLDDGLQYMAHLNGLLIT